MGNFHHALYVFIGGALRGNMLAAVLPHRNSEETWIIEFEDFNVREEKEPPLHQAILNSIILIYRIHSKSYLRYCRPNCHTPAQTSSFTKMIKY
jgi:hypothetical protein